MLNPEEYKSNIHKAENELRHTHRGIMGEKSDIQIPAQTPRGSLVQHVSIPVAALVM